MNNENWNLNMPISSKLEEIFKELLKSLNFWRLSIRFKKLLRILRNLQKSFVDFSRKILILKAMPSKLKTIEPIWSFSLKNWLIQSLNKKFLKPNPQSFKSYKPKICSEDYLSKKKSMLWISNVYNKKKLLNKESSKPKALKNKKWCKH